MNLSINLYQTSHHSLASHTQKKRPFLSLLKTLFCQLKGRRERGNHFSESFLPNPSITVRGARGLCGGEKFIIQILVLLLGRVVREKKESSLRCILYLQQLFGFSRKILNPESRKKFQPQKSKINQQVQTESGSTNVLPYKFNVLSMHPLACLSCVPIFPILTNKALFLP